MPVASGYHPAMSDDASVSAAAHDWAAAMVTNDPARIAHFMADDWVIVSESGVSTREQFLALVESGDLTHSAFRIVGDVRVRVHGDSAVVTGRVVNTAHYRGERFDAELVETALVAGTVPPDAIVEVDDEEMRPVLVLPLNVAEG